uniref:UBX domain-containing protein n=1 Tax=Polytomella parva TaxID=51329 RepID=A0A7S0YDD9_9CHLO|mmetsp:Transcript_11176/g.20225  ORF Transcript_11176/g.20225 Transcript_11176/m.20225 type:complete len:282 (+) Transcript_11176:219-1064(+)|eukprot:CAMPEP_0175052256 /NCGR_PEP_ID=MMETSP0052_2-20121109/8260_1 /TAXON_ID=51329 ORGANISM="Polytomella parva, Strain SAG 63-3" /NCGR_SAMPLE_ID=MMETSP0052_2 /ASSEMBLY_ACC=CAM_ASM_000194 /LENGTH=281 /DNA_ID=CAMNT_0016316643 /DNA_START=206 /DNA_END=1051 /DNA_ORIENTATION=+
MSNIRGLSDLKDEDEPKDKNNDYYAGGEKSGQLIRGAPEDSDSDEVESFFNSARKVGARSGSSSDLPSQAFRGAARNINGETKEAPMDALNRVITFYSNGVFTVDDGLMRHVADPSNLDFLSSISRGETPRELEDGAKGRPITVNLIRRDEPYVPPPASTTFTGTARTLGSSSALSSSSTATTMDGDLTSSDAEPFVGVDDSKPTTALQLRLPDGSRQVAKFNRCHTIRDVRRFLQGEVGKVVGTGFQLVAPPNRLFGSDVLDKTLEEADLISAVLIVKKA